MLGTLGLGLPQLLASRLPAGQAGQASEASATFGRAKRMILLYMWGGPAHQDTWDLKPEGPVELRGEFLPIETNVPGLHVSEHFPLIAGQADKLAVIRSVGQEDNNHSTGAHAALTGRRHELKAENFGARETDFPHFGSVLTHLRANAGGMPTAVSLPEIIATTAGVITPGQFGGLLGRDHDPFLVNQHPDLADFGVSALELPGGVTARRMRERQRLLQHVEAAAAVSERSSAAGTMQAFYDRALEMLLSEDVRRAFDLQTVPDAERWRYGWHTFGQSTLLARRLIEAGVQLVTVYWHREKKTVDSSWDTHALNFQELRNRLMPSVDRPIAALLEDLQQRGLLDETLVVWNSEFGRTPRINQNAGRDHWGPCNSVVMAGGGVPGGQVFGASDRAAAYPVRDKVTQDDIAATIYHLLGIAPETLIHDRLNRPFPIALGEPIHALLGDSCPPTDTSPPAPLPVRPSNGPITRFLMERGGRFLCCEFGWESGEREWEFIGWTNGHAERPSRARFPQDAALLKYTGHWHPHFDYSHLVFWLDQPTAARQCRLTVNGTALPIAEDAEGAAGQRVWQVPLPEGFVKQSSRFELQLVAPQWPVCAVAVTGDRIRELHLKHGGFV